MGSIHSLLGTMSWRCLLLVAPRQTSLILEVRLEAETLEPPLSVTRGDFGNCDNRSNNGSPIPVRANLCIIILVNAVIDASQRFLGP